MCGLDVSCNQMGSADLVQLRAFCRWIIMEAVLVDVKRFCLQDEAVGNSET